MPLDADAVTDLHSLDGQGRAAARLLPARVVLTPEGDVGRALRAAREGLGLSVEDIAQATRVRPAHIAAIEAFDLESLPSRPFVVGFVRAYARCLGLETEAVVDRFRAGAPGHDQKLRAPIALNLHTRRRFGWLGAVIAVVIGGVVAWNVARHAPPPRRPMARFAPVRPAPAPMVMVPARLGAPLPAPPEAAPPPAYETPGLAPPDAAAVPAPPTPGRPFAPAGAIYGARRPNGGVVLQAIRPTTLVVRGGGAVYFARQLAAGEAWRAPAVAGLSIDVGAPADMEVFVAGLSRGPLTQAQTPVAALTQPNP